MSALQHRIGMLTFRQRLVLLTAAAVAIAVVFASGIAYFVVREQLREHVDDELRGLAADIPAPSALAFPGLQNQVLVLPPEEPLGGKDGYAQLVRSDRSVLRPSGATVHLPVGQGAVDVASGKRGAYFEDRTLDGVHSRVYTAPYASGVALQAAWSLEDVDRTLREIALVLVLIGAGGIAVAVWLGMMVARTALRPVSELTQAAEQVARTGDLSRRMRTSGSDELSRLGASFNTMLEALQSSEHTQRQLVADASHELRTPLTSLRTNIEVLAQVDALPPEDRERLLADVLAQLDELTVLVTDLVDLARGDEHASVAEDVRLDMLVGDAVERARRHALDRRFETHLEPSLVRGVPSRLDRAVTNLLDNAAKWSPSGGRIEVRVADGEVRVRDHGPGITESDLPFVFDRFYRAPAARGLPGSGLGLAIVRQVAESHGGAVHAERPSDGGALFVMRLPVLAEDSELEAEARLDIPGRRR
jgi:two-component system, OmpR family, sensor histidine kinase MprB